MKYFNKFVEKNYKMNTEKIKETELKVGNLFTYHTSEGVHMCRIDWQDIKFFNENPEKFNEIHSKIKICKGVLGLSNYKNMPGLFESESGEIIVTKDGLVFLYRRHMRHIKYIHQLQNLHSALYDEEIEFRVLDFKF